MTESRAVRGWRCALAVVATSFALGLATVPAQAACSGDAGGIGGTGQAPKGETSGSRGKGKDRGGIGGTGRSERDAGGIGGTGVRAAGDAGGIGGTGIVGVITGFGSVCVNGLEVEYDASAAIDVNGAPAGASALAVGQVVVIEARDRDGALHAERIAVRDAAVGPIERVGPGRDEIEVVGQRVRIDAATRIDAAGGAATLRPGDFVAVSGLRGEDGHVVATRIDAAPPGDRVSVTGPILERDQGGAAVGGLALELPKAAIPATLPERLVLAIGHIDPDSGALRTERIEPAVRFDAKPERLSLEALVQRPGAKSFHTEHGEVDASAVGKGAAPPAGARVIVDGSLDATGRVQARQIEVVAPERPAPPGPGRPKDAPPGRRSDDHDARTSIEKVEKPERPEKAGEVEHPEKPEKPEAHEKPEPVEKPETPERVERPEAPEVEHPEAPEVERPEAPEVHEVERPETPELPEIERPETPEAPELPEVERPETPERPEVERPEAPERPEIERPETPELPEIEAPELPEIEAPELPEIEHPEHDD